MTNIETVLNRVRAEVADVRNRLGGLSEALRDAHSLPATRQHLEQACASCESAEFLARTELHMIEAKMNDKLRDGATEGRPSSPET